MLISCQFPPIAPTKRAFGLEWRHFSIFTHSNLFSPGSTILKKAHLAMRDVQRADGRFPDRSVGLKFLRMEKGKAVFEVESGEYKFLSRMN
jgi:hypothetical protein